MRSFLSLSRAAQQLWQRTGGPLRRFGLAVWILRVLVLAPSPLAADPSEKSQSLAVQDVLIEGKLYSPQALFILSRTAEDFGRDAVLPHYLGRASTARFLPYRLRDDVFFAALAQQVVVVGDTLVASPVSRRSP